MTQPALAEQSGVSLRSISDYEQGKAQPTMRQLEKLSVPLKVSPAWLLGGDDSTLHMFKDEESTPYSTGTVSVSLLGNEALEAAFKSLAAQLTDSDEPERTRILEAINSVNAERRRRKPGKLIQPPLNSEEQQRLLAAGLKHAGIGHETGDKSGSGQPSGAGEPPSHKPSPPGASGHPTKAPRPAREEQD